MDKSVKRSFFLIFLLLGLIAASLVLFSACGQEEYEQPQENYYSVTYLAEEGGEVDGIAEQSVKEGENAEEVTAIPDNGYKFIKWSDGVTSVTRQDTNVTSEIAVTAEFEKITYTVQYLAGAGGTISGNTDQQIKYNENAEEVTAIPDNGYKFLKWSDGVTSATRHDTNVSSTITVTAYFQRYSYMQYAVRFLSKEGGSIYYIENRGEYIYYGESSSKVRAKPQEGYAFLYWSDGSTEVERQISFVTENITLTAYFGYSADYVVNNNVGGKIMGNTHQGVFPGDDFEEVVAVADEGYVFAGWSDLKIQSSRQDLSAERCWEYVAYFEPIKKTFKYDYAEAAGEPLVNEVTINRSELSNVEFVVPKLLGYTFCGWYADKDYSLMVVNESGIYMLGVYGLSIETDTLYAKWKKTDADEGIVHKILVVVVQDIESTLYSKKADKYIEVDYSMTAIERAFCSVLPKQMSLYLNDWFREKDIHFEVDSYYTLQTVHLNSSGTGDYRIFANELPELGILNLLYHNVIVLHSMNDYDYLLHNVSGISMQKYADVYIDSSLSSYIVNHRPLQTVLSEWINDEYPQNLMSVVTCLHEFAHTCENNYSYTEILEYHQVYNDYIVRAGELGLTNRQAIYEATRVYLLGIAELNGQIGGVPIEYFRHEIDIDVNYVDTRIDGRSAGRIVVVGEAPPEKPWITYVSRKIAYGSSITVEAIPQDGYRFLKWSDGVTTAIRTDTVISYVTVKAVFVVDN